MRKAHLFRDEFTLSPAVSSDDALVVDDVPPPAGDSEKFMAFFAELDSYTEYWDLYHPELRGQYMADYSVLARGVLGAWDAFAVAEQGAASAGALDALRRQVADPKATAALRDVDTLMRGLIHKHFASVDGTGLDTGAYLAAIEMFARDILPADPARAAKVPDGDGRKPFAGRHTMDGPGQWFVWAGLVDCTTLLDGNTDAHRTVQIAGAALGSAMDFTFRGAAGTRGRTRPEYKPDIATATTLRGQSAQWASDPASAQSQARALYRIFHG